MLWGSGFGGEIQLKVTHLLFLHINLFIKPGLNTFSRVHPSPARFLFVSRVTPLSLCMYFGRLRCKGENMSNYLDRFKVASCPLGAWWFLDTKPDRNIPLWRQKWKGNILQNTWLRKRQVLKVTMTWTTGVWSSVKICLCHVFAERSHKDLKKSTLLLALWACAAC